MTTNLPSDKFREESSSQAVAEPTPESAAAKRIDQLFRDSLKRQLVHPLRDLIKQYRERGTS